MIGKIVKVIVDRPLGSYHPVHKDMYYPVNYGFVEGIVASDGEYQDAYILGVDTAVKEFTGIVIAVVHRHDDVEEKWVVTPENGKLHKRRHRKTNPFSGAILSIGSLYVNVRVFESINIPSHFRHCREV